MSDRPPDAAAPSGAAPTLAAVAFAALAGVLGAAVVVSQLDALLAAAAPAPSATSDAAIDPSVVALRFAAYCLGLAALGVALADGLGALLAWPLRRAGHPRAGRLLRAAPPALVLALLYADARLFAAQALHLDDGFVLTGMRAGNLGESHLGATTLLALAVALLATPLALAALRRALERRAARGALGPPWAWFALWLLIAVGGVWSGAWTIATLAEGGGAAEALPLARRLAAAVACLEGDDVATAPTGDLVAAHPGARAIQGVSLQRRPDVLLLQVESWRGDSLDPRWMPRLHALREALPCLRSERHFAGSHTTVWSTFALLFGVDATLFTAIAEAGLGSAPLALFAASGYELRAASASQLRGWDRGDHVVAAFGARYQEHLSGDAPARDRAVIAALRGWLAPAAPVADRKPMFAFGFLYAPHHNYHFPPEHARHQPVLPLDYNHFAPDDQLAHHATEIRNRYRNSLDFIDAELAALLAALRPRVEAGDLVIAITGDHGEEFWDHGAVGHGAARFWDARVAVPLVLCGVGLAGRSQPLSSHVDLLPTLIDLLQPAPPLPAARWSTGRSLLREDAATQVVITGVGYPHGGDLLATVDVEAGGRVKRWWRRQGDALAPTLVRRTDGDDRELPPPDTAASAADAAASERLQRRLRRFLRREAALASAVPEGFRRIDHDFAGVAALVAARVEGEVAPAAALRVELLWRRQPGAPPPSGGLFCHLLRREGAGFAMVRNLDHVPADGALPPSAWPAEGLVRDVVHLTLPPGPLPAGGLLLRVGLLDGSGDRVGPAADVPLLPSALLP